ncbi:FAD/NAD(P)-binding domain [Phytophthora cactorum]|nr:FAD/NAD(P)-binding domain [Phytophthora cactorum]
MSFYAKEETGIRVAQALTKSLSESDNAEVIVLEAIFFFYHAVGAPRAYVDGDYTNKMFIPTTTPSPSMPPSCAHHARSGDADLADTNEVSYHAIGSDDKQSETTEKLKFDYLVLATGSTYSVPIKPDSRDYARSATEAKLQEVRDHIEKAEKVLVVGGGAVGCEVAAEIKAKYPSKLVTIVDANKQLISGNNLRDKILRIFECFDGEA